MKFTYAHNSINVLDIERSVDFYRKTLGLKIHHTKGREDDDYKLVFLESEGSTNLLELTWLRDRTEPYNLGDNEIHFAFEADDFDAAYAFHNELGVVCFENKAFGVYFIADPDGYWTEIVPRKVR